VSPEKLAELMVKHDLEILKRYKSDKPEGSVWAREIE